MSPIAFTTNARGVDAAAPPCLPYRMQQRPVLYTPEQLFELDGDLLAELRAELRGAITRAERRRVQADIDRIEARRRRDNRSLVADIKAAYAKR